MPEPTSPERSPTHPSSAGPAGSSLPASGPLRDRAAGIPSPAWVADPAGLVVDVNDHWHAYVGRGPRLQASIALDPAIHPADAPQLAIDWGAAAERDETITADVRLRGRDGDFRWFRIRAEARRVGWDGSSRVQGWVGTAVDIDDLLRDAKAREQQRFLADATVLLSTSLQYDETMAQVAELVVPRLADWCAIDLLDDAGELRSIAIAHVDPDLVAHVRALRSDYPDDPDQPTGPLRVARTGLPVFVPEVEASAMEAAARDERHGTMLRRLDLRSYLCVPLTTAGRTLGSLTLASSMPDRRYGPSDLAFAEALASRAAAAIETARVYREAERFRRIVDSVVEAIVLFEPDSHRIEEVNRGAAELFGRPRDALVGEPIETLVARADVSRLVDLIEPLAAGQGESSTVLLDLVNPRGGTTAAEVILQPVDRPDGTRGIVAIARDIRERVEAQVRLQRLAQAEHARAAELNAVIRAMGEAVVVCAEDGRITLTNPAGESLFPAVTETTYADILAELHDPDGRAPKLGTQTGPIELPTRSDADRWIEVTTYPVNIGAAPGAAGRETIVVMRDVTDARRREAVRETFIGVLSHELRTPVTTIFGGAKLLARESSTLDDETRRSIFRDIHDEAERLQRLVEDVVALNRFAESDDDIGREPVLLQRLLPRVIASEEGRWPGVAFVLDIAPALPTVTADATYVEQVVRNLISNAAKYGGVDSTVTLAADAGDGEVRVRVLDNGPGFESEEANRIFELFYRSPRTAGSAAGAGIGLFVCARLIAAMGGRIWAVARPGGGSEFGFALAELHE